jgi:ribosome-associated heat shock protein Hsp15
MACGLRVDRWLWFARFFKSRSIASVVCATRKVRINGAAPAKANHLLRIGDVLTFPAGEIIRVVQVAALGTRRGPAAEARSLYEDLTPPAPPGAPAKPSIMAVAARSPGAGRPTKAQRRALDRLRGSL